MSDGTEAVAFNAGCDARIAGLPESANPYYDGRLPLPGAAAWRSGWRHVNLFWGADCRQPCWRLPEVPAPAVEVWS